MQDLRRYPGQIEEAANRIVDQERAVEEAKRKVSKIEAEIDQVVANDEDLTNKTKRDARREALRADDEAYQDAISALDQAEAIRAKLVNELERLRSEFSVAKLELRREIVQAIRSRRLENDEVDDLVSGSPVYDAVVEQFSREEY
jgi:chromosome segregation ATPase